ncbi:MAG: hypothetical protein JSV34_06865 [Candidatus Omnitrophota bacterium]|nr:MAG: hypothetical protein JSV34_06865 [Candidatus Omnitrophota bacterium]
MFKVFTFFIVIALLFFVVPLTGYTFEGEGEEEPMMPEDRWEQPHVTEDSEPSFHTPEGEKGTLPLPLPEPVDEKGAGPIPLPRPAQEGMHTPEGEKGALPLPLPKPEEEEQQGKWERFWNRIQGR